MKTEKGRDERGTNMDEIGTIWQKKVKKKTKIGDNSTIKWL